MTIGQNTTPKTVTKIMNKRTQAWSVRKRGQFDMTGHAWYDNNYEGKA